MSTVCLKRFALYNCRIFRQIYACEGIVTASPFFTNSDVPLKKCSSLHSTCANTKLIIQPPSLALRCYSDKSKLEVESAEKKSLLQRFKQMYRDYWYVLVPVHLVTSAAWFGGFYYLAKSGVDIVGILETWNVSSKITNSLKDSSMGYIAVSYALYKLATPLRYTVTLGGTTISINYLKHFGYIKPVPSREQLREMYKERRDTVMESLREKTEFYKEKTDSIIEQVRETKLELTAQKDQLKDRKDSLVKDLETSLEKIKMAKELNKPENLVKISKKDER